MFQNVTIFGYPIEEIFVIYDDSVKCNQFSTCYKVAPTHIRVNYDVFLLVPMGFFWATAYALYIFFGFKFEKSYMPYFPLLLNISWEFYFGFIRGSGVNRGGLLFKPLCILWVLLDCVLFFLFLKYGQSRLPIQVLKGGNGMKFYYLLFCLILCYGTVWTISVQFYDYVGTACGFFQNAIMSFWYVYEYLDMEDVRKIDWIDCLGVVFRMIGTWTIGLYYYLIMVNENVTLMYYFFFVIAVCDSLYFVMCLYSLLYLRKKKDQ